LRIKYLILFLFISVLAKPAYCQVIPQPVSSFGIYDFLDELAAQKLTELNSAIKPYSRLFIAEKLRFINENKREELSPRQKKELDFYLMDFGKELNSGKDWKRRKDLFYYKDSLFTMTLNVILGGEVFSNSAGRATYWRNGIEASTYIGKWGFYASLRDNHETPYLGLPQYLTDRTDGNNKNGNSWEDMRGGVTWSWKWGYAGLVKDQAVWGNNSHGANIFGGNNPSFIQLRLNIKPTKWFEYNYFHGWLTSMVTDSSRSYWTSNSYGNVYRIVYHKKFIAANMLTVTPFKNFNLSAGNSIVYADLDVFPAYLVPVFFYKAIDHYVNQGIDNMNSQMFIDVSSRQIKNLHLYASLFIDELSVSRFFKSNEWNFLCWKGGLNFYNFPVKDLSFTAEYTYSYPLTYQHKVPTITYQTSDYNLGWYLKDNSRELYLALNYRPVRTLNVGIFFSDAVRGPDYTELGTPRIGNPPLATIQWHNTSFGFRSSFQIINDLYCWAGFTYSDIAGDGRWTAPFFYGRKSTVNAGLTMGF
jgi:hypothetical protein